MKKRTIVLFVILGVVAAFMALASAFFVLQSVSAAEKEWAYFEVYKKQAEAYARESEYVKQTYGENAYIRFEDSVSYEPMEKKGFLESYFDVKAPESLEAFDAEMRWIKLSLQIEQDDYVILFEKDENGAFYVSALQKTEK